MTATDSSLPTRKRRNYQPVVLIAAAVLVCAVVTALFAHWIAPYPFDAIDLKARTKPPVFYGGTWAHPLGTDELGRDILSRLVVSLRTSLSIAVTAALISATVGVTLGLLAAMARGKVDSVIRVAIDFSASVPFLILALAVLAFYGNSLTLFVCLLGTYGWERYARLVRALAMVEFSKGYVAALRRIGAGRLRITFGHVLRNVLPVIIINLTVSLPEIILLETGLSFLGVGIQPPLSSLGNMIGLGRDYIITAWWIATLPGIAIFLITLAVSIIGDWVRDYNDPSLR
jgi:peptide/nickel transport system permease protein